jgi:hypothetical protein
VVFLCKAVIGLLDVGGAGTLVDTESSVGIGYCGRRW